MQYENLTVGTHIYYTGDMANIPGTGIINSIMPNGTYIIAMQYGRIMRGINGCQFSHPSKNNGHRFEVSEERAEYRAEQIRKFQEEYTKA